MRALDLTEENVFRGVADADADAMKRRLEADLAAACVEE